MVDYDSDFAGDKKWLCCSYWTDTLERRVIVTWYIEEGDAETVYMYKST